MSIKATAVVKKESIPNPRTGNNDIYALLALFDENEKEYGLPRRLANFDEVAALLTREAGVTYEQLNDRHPRYERGDEVRISLNLESVAAISRLGFNTQPSA